MIPLGFLSLHLPGPFFALLWFISDIGERKGLVSKWGNWCKPRILGERKEGPSGGCVLEGLFCFIKGLSEVDIHRAPPDLCFRDLGL